MAIQLEQLVSHLWDWRWITTALVFVMTYLVGSFYYKVSRYPRGPFPLPLFGNLLAIRKAKDLHTAANEWSKTYGDVFTLWMSHSPLVFLNSNKAIREAFLDRKHDFSGRIPTTMGDIINQGDHDIFFEDYTPRWKALRKVLLLAVRKYAVSEAVEKLSTEVVDTCVESLQYGSQLVDSRKLIFHILYTLMGVSVYGTRLDGDNEEIRQFEENNEAFRTLAPNGLPSDTAPWLAILYRGTEKKVASLLRDSRDIICRLFAKAEDTYISGQSDNFTHAILAAREEAIREEKEDAEYLTRGNLILLVRNTFIGGTDTSAGILQWLFLRMAKEPKIQEKIQKEIEDNIGSTAPVYEDRAKLPYTVACLMETLRCHPISPLGLPHKTSADTKVGDVRIPKDTGIMFNIYGVNHDPEIWDDPQQFRPERFLDPMTGKLSQDAKQVLTFSTGPRTCPGEKLAHVDMFYVLVRLMQRLSCSAPGKPSDVNVDDIASKLLMLPVKQNIILTRKK